MANEALSQAEKVSRIMESLPSDVDHAKYSIVSGVCIDILMSPEAIPKRSPRPEHGDAPEQQIDRPN